MVNSSFSQKLLSIKFVVNLTKFIASCDSFIEWYLYDGRFGEHFDTVFLG